MKTFRFSIAIALLATIFVCSTSRATIQDDIDGIATQAGYEAVSPIYYLTITVNNYQQIAHGDYFDIKCYHHWDDTSFHRFYFKNGSGTLPTCVYCGRDHTIDITSLTSNSAVCSAIDAAVENVICCPDEDYFTSSGNGVFYSAITDVYASVAFSGSGLGVNYVDNGTPFWIHKTNTYPESGVVEVAQGTYVGDIVLRGNVKLIGVGNVVIKGDIKNDCGNENSIQNISVEGKISPRINTGGTKTAMPRRGMIHGTEVLSGDLPFHFYFIDPNSTAELQLERAGSTHGDKYNFLISVCSGGLIRIKDGVMAESPTTLAEIENITGQQQQWSVETVFDAHYAHWHLTYKQMQ